jgi:hypothetical protein
MTVLSEHRFYHPFAELGLLTRQESEAQAITAWLHDQHDWRSKLQDQATVDAWRADVATALNVKITETSWKSIVKVSWQADLDLRSLIREVIQRLGYTQPSCTAKDDARSLRLQDETRHGVSNSRRARVDEVELLARGLG